MGAPQLGLDAPTGLVNHIELPHGLQLPVGVNFVNGCIKCIHPRVDLAARGDARALVLRVGVGICVGRKFFREQVWHRGHVLVGPDMLRETIRGGARRRRRTRVRMPERRQAHHTQQSLSGQYERTREVV